MNDTDDREPDNDVESARRHPSSGAGSVPPERDATIPAPTDPDNHITAEVLSAWLDDPAEVPIEARQAIETHLSGCPVCQRTLEDLRAIVLALSALPQVETPRPFALTSDMVAEATPKPVSLRESPRRPVILTESRPWYDRQLAALRWATAVAAILFVFVVSADIISRDSASNNDDDTAGMIQSKQEATVATGGGAIAEDATTLMTDEDQASEATSGAGAESTPMAASAAEEAEPTEAAAEAEAPESEEEQAAESTPASGDVAPESADTQTTSDDTVAAYSATEASGDQGEQAAQAETSEAARDGSGGDEVADATSELAMESQSDDGTGDTGETGSTVANADDSDSTWRLLQVGLALLIVWLLAAMIALPRLRPRTGDTTE